MLQGRSTVLVTDWCRVVARHQRARLTYKQLWLRSNAFARGLRDAGVQKGDRVAVSLGNSAEYAIVCFYRAAVGMLG